MYFIIYSKGEKGGGGVLKEGKMASDEDDLAWKYYTYYTHMQRESSIPLIYILWALICI